MLLFPVYCRDGCCCGGGGGGCCCCAGAASAPAGAMAAPAAAAAASPAGKTGAPAAAAPTTAAAAAAATGPAPGAAPACACCAAAPSGICICRNICCCCSCSLCCSCCSSSCSAPGWFSGSRFRKSTLSVRSGKRSCSSCSMTLIVSTAASVAKASVWLTASSKYWSRSGAIAAAGAFGSKGTLRLSDPRPPAISKRTTPVLQVSALWGQYGPPSAISGAMYGMLPQIAVEVVEARARIACWKSTMRMCSRSLPARVVKTKCCRQMHR
mmetsp:Transcript_96603/g.171774  ORF Transcript_96603/g.171774 Transcript_96603/m.171774 type:complete len:268 (+) Transcript_96603:104-907(+)